MRASNVLFLVLVLLGPAMAEAGSAPSESGAELYGHVAMQRWTEKVLTEMNAREVNVAIVARCGRARDKMPAGVEFTHTGIAVFEPVVKRDGSIGHTYTVYNLYQGADGDKNRSYLAQDFMADLTAGAVEPEIGVIVPSDEVQKSIVRVLRSPAAAAFTCGRYNLLDNPYNDRYENCTSYILKVLVAAIYETDDLERVNANIRAHFTAQEVDLSGLEKMAVHFASGIQTDDREDGNYRTTSFLSLERFLAENGLLKESFRVRMDEVDVLAATK